MCHSMLTLAKDWDTKLKRTIQLDSHSAFKLLLKLHWSSDFASWCLKKYTWSAMNNEFCFTFSQWLPQKTMRAVIICTYINLLVVILFPNFVTGDKGVLLNGAHQSLCLNRDKSKLVLNINSFIYTESTIKIGNVFPLIFFCTVTMHTNVAIGTRKSFKPSLHSCIQFPNHRGKV